MARFSSSHFTIHNGEEQGERVTTFVSELSTLTNGGLTDYLHQIYQDACDAGLTIISATTGSSVDYYHSEEKFDTEGDLIYIVLKPTPESIRKVPKAKNTKVKIFNT